MIDDITSSSVLGFGEEFYEDFTFATFLMFSNEVYEIFDQWCVV